MSAPNLVPPGTTGGGAPVGGSGTIGKIPKWDTTTTLGDSVITESAGAIATTTLTAGGAGYTNGTYGQQALTGGAGTGATADFTVAGGIVTFCLLRAPGVGYLAGDVLSCATIGPGAGLIVTVATVVPALATVGNISANRLGAGTTNPLAPLGVVGGAMMDGATRTVTFNTTTTNPVSSLNTLTIGSANAPAIIAQSPAGTDALHINTLVDASMMSGYTTIRGIQSNALISATAAARTGRLTSVNAQAYRREPGDLSTVLDVVGFNSFVGAGPGIGSATTQIAMAYGAVVQSGNAGHTITNGLCISAAFSANPGNITTATGFLMNPVVGAGTVGTYYGVRIQASTTPTITNRWGISQEDTLAKNYFAGNVGIGTTSPGGLLHLSKTSDTDYLALKVENIPSTLGNISSGYIGFYSNPGNGSNNALSTGKIYGKFDTNSYASARLTFSTVTGSDVYVDTMTLKAGNVGIGTTSPTAPLHVAGDVAAYPTTGVYGQLEVTGKTTPAHRLAIGYNSTANCGFIQSIHDATIQTPLLLNPGGGNVGIGTTSPACALDVAGTIKTAGYTVATLPAGTAGQRAYVTDATAPTYLGALVGGGAVVVPVFHNGTAWVSA